MNISGNWNTSANVMFNTAIGKQKKFNFQTNTNFNYSNNVGYISTNTTDDFDINRYVVDGVIDMNRLFSENTLSIATTKSTSVGEYLRFNYRDDFAETGSIEVGINGGFTYQHARNDMQARSNIDSWNFNYGGNLILNLPWGIGSLWGGNGATNISTDFTPQYRRGYQDASMNTTELIWNAQISQSFLKNNALTISAQWYDILKERSSISRNISATMRSDTYTNAIHSYLMFHVIYKLNLIGNKEAREAMRGMGPGGGPGGGFGGPGGGPGGGRGRW